jgi:hypothetical protein
MADHITLDVIDRPAGGVIRGVRRLRALRAGGAPGLRALITLGTADFATRPFPPPTTPRRLAVLTAWHDADAVADCWEPTIGVLSRGAREHWHVHGELARASFSEAWRGWDPQVVDARNLDDDEPALILIAGDLRARFVPAFVRDAMKAAAHAFEQPGYLGGLAINSSLLNTTSCSTWRTYADAKAYAYRPGRHSEAMKRDRAEERHSTEWFMRVRPLAERGTLNGRAPFAEVLRPAVAA